MQTIASMINWDNEMGAAVNLFHIDQPGFNCQNGKAVNRASDNRIKTHSRTREGNWCQIVKKEGRPYVTTADGETIYKKANQMAREAWLPIHTDYRSNPKTCCVIDWLGEIFSKNKKQLSGKL